MILDKFNEFTDATSAVINVGNAILGDVIDLGATPTLRDLGNGQPLYWVIQVDTAFTDGAGETATVKLELASDSTANLATSKTVHATFDATIVTTLVAGYQKIIPLPIQATYERYLGVWETVATANLATGKLNMFLTTDPNGWRAYPDAI